jgi:hypothetical protein
MPDSKLILVIGGTGGQGMPVVKGQFVSQVFVRVLTILSALSSSSRYHIRVLTRSAASTRAKELAALPNVTLMEGSQDQQKDLHRAFNGVYGAWVNMDGFTLGEKSELFYGIRAYEIARHHGVKHFLWANTDYAVKKAGWDEKYHWGHNDAKGRVGDLILRHGQETMKTSLLTTGPYMDMLFDGMYVPKEQVDGSFVWANPARKSCFMAFHVFR